MQGSKRGNRYFDRPAKRPHISDDGIKDGKDEDRSDDYHSDDYRPNAPPPTRENDWRVRDNPSFTNSRGHAGLRQNDRPPQYGASSRRNPSPPRGAHLRRANETHERDSGRHNHSNSADYKVDRTGGQGADVNGDNNDDDDWGFVRKGRRFVRKGRIAKRVKVNEVNVHTSLFCNTCQLTFRNVNEKLAHEMSKDHIAQSERNSGFAPDNRYIKNEYYSNLSENYYGAPDLASGDGMDLDHSNITPHSKYSVSVPGIISRAWPLQPVNPVAVRNEIDELIKEGTKFISASGLNEDIPPSFKTWAERSLDAVESKIASGEADPSERIFVNREVLYTLTREIRNSTLFRVDWRNVELATGDVVKPKLATDRNYTIEEIEQMEALYEEDQIQEQIALLLPTNPFSKAEEKTNSRPESVAGSVDATRAASKSSVELKNSGHTDLSEARPRTLKKLIKRCPPPRLMERGRILSLASADIPEGLVLQWHRTRSTLSNAQDENLGQSHLTSLTSQLAKAEGKVRSGKYDANSILQDLEEIGPALLDAGPRLSFAISAFQLCLRLAIDVRDHLKIAEYSDRLANMCIHLGLKKNNGVYVALWLLSLVYSRSPETSGLQKSFLESPIFLVSSLRQIPRKSLQENVVSEALGALVAFTTNHWVDFLRYFEDQLSHSQAEGYTKDVCYILVKPAYERALLTMFRQGKDGKCPYDLPGHLKLGDIMASFACGDEDVDRMASLRDIMQSMSDPLWIVGSTSDGADTLVKCEDKEGLISRFDKVNMSLLFKLNGDAFQISED